VLHAHEKLSVPLYITVGSPLAVGAIRRRLRVKPSRPSCAANWFNAFDVQDIVALNPLDEQHFPTDDEITNDGRVSNWTENHHGILGYLDDATVAKKIFEYAD